jgi:histidyl-tRNA synthetase
VGCWYQGKYIPAAYVNSNANSEKAEFLYKVKPKLPNQFKAAENNGTPFSVILGETEVAEGKVKIKENGLREGHPEKDGVMVPLTDLVSEVRQRLERKANLESLAKHAEGLKVVGGIKGEPESIKSETEKPVEEKPAEETPVSQEAIAAVPAS